MLGLMYQCHCGEDNKDSLIAIAGGMHQYTYVLYKYIVIP